MNLTRPIEILNLITDLGFSHDSLLQLIDDKAAMNFTIYPVALVSGDIFGLSLPQE